MLYCHSLQALDIPYRAVGAAEPNDAFRSVILSNFQVEHLHGTMAEQVAEKVCIHHKKCGQVSCSLTECDLCVFGTPCNPFSEMRVKRFRDGSVAQHPLASITFVDAKNMIVQGRHRCIIMEQVAGFDKPESAGDTFATPMQRFLHRK